MAEVSGKLACEGAQIAWRRVSGAGPTVIWLGGFASDMTGTKAQALADWAAASGRAFLRFDYFGHGASEGRFEDGTITRWRADALAVIDELTEGPLVLVGSSMGGWIACLAAIERDGAWLRPSEYEGEGYPITRELLEDGARWNILDGPVGITAPVRILQGGADTDVPWRHALKLAEALEGPDVVFTLVRDGDHRLSRPQDITRLIAAVEEFFAA